MSGTFKAFFTALTTIVLLAYLSMACARAEETPSRGASAAVGSLAVARAGDTAALLSGEKVLIAVGGRRGENFSNAAVPYDPAAKPFSATGEMATDRAGHTATLPPDGEVLIAGGWNRAYCKAFSMAATTCSLSGVTFGSNRAMTLPFLSTRNLLKFHFMSPAYSGFVSLSVRNL